MHALYHHVEHKQMFRFQFLSLCDYKEHLLRMVHSFERMYLGQPQHIRLLFATIHPMLDYQEYYSIK